MSARGIIAFLSCLAVFAHAQAPPGSTTPESVLPIASFIRGPDVRQMRLSPDGTHVAFTAGKDASELLVVVNLDERKVAATIRAEEHFRINYFHWVAASRIVYSHSKSFSGWGADETLRAVNRDGTQHAVIYRSGYDPSSRVTDGVKAKPASPFFINALRHDDRHVLIGEAPWSRRGNTWQLNRDAEPSMTLVDVYDGSRSNRGVVPLIEPDVLIDASGTARFAVGYDPQRNQRAIWRPGATADWTPIPLNGFRDDSIEPWSLTTDGAKLFFSGVRSDEDFARLYKLDLSSRDVERVAEIPNADVTSIIPSFDGTQIVGVAGFAAGQKDYHWLAADDPAARLIESLRRTFAGHEIKLLDTTDDGRRSLVFVESDRSPGEYFLYDSQTKRADMLRAARPDIDPRSMRPRESISLTSRDGMPLHGYLTRPASPGPHKLVALPHDVPFKSRSAWAFDSIPQLLASRGYAVLQVNYRGSTGYGRSFEAAGYRKWGTAIQDDVADATRWAIDQKIADPDRVCILGSGFGGYSALMNAAREPKLYRCAIGIAGRYDLPAWYQKGDMAESERNDLARTMGSDLTMLRSQSPLDHAERIEAAVLLIQIFDAEDRMEHTEDMYAQLNKSHKHVELFKMTDVQRADVIRLAYERVLLFLDSQLK